MTHVFQIQGAVSIPVNHLDGWFRYVPGPGRSIGSIIDSGVGSIILLASRNQSIFHFILKWLPKIDGPQSVFTIRLQKDGTVIGGNRDGHLLSLKACEHEQHAQGKYFSFHFNPFIF
jgi:hypothetical protein